MVHLSGFINWRLYEETRVIGCVWIPSHLITLALFSSVNLSFPESWKNPRMEAVEGTKIWMSGEPEILPYKV